MSVHCSRPIRAPWRAVCVAGAVAPALRATVPALRQVARTLAGAMTLICLLLVCTGVLVPPAFAADNQVDTSQLPDGSFIYEAEIADLAADNTYYNNQTVQVTGEVVGDRIRAEGDDTHCWITLSALNGEDSGSIQVLVSTTQADLIDSYGRYGVTGSKVRVMGTFHANCGTHESLEDIHASDLVVEAAGESNPDELDGTKLSRSVVLVVVGLLVLFGYRRYRARTR